MAASSFTCELSIVRAKNTDSLPEGSSLFVRFYLSTAAKKDRIHLDTQQVENLPECSWNPTFSLQCSGAEDSVDELKQDSLIFELRQRRKRTRVALLGGASSSKLLGRGEVPWRTAFEAPNMEIESWVPIIPSRSCSCKEGVKPPSIKVVLKIRFGSMLASEIGAQQLRRKRAGETGCSCERRCDQQWGCGTGDEYHNVFAIGVVLEAL